MNAYVAVTDQDWYQFLADQEDVDEVNFWTPKPWGGEFGVLSRGEMLLFKLKAPINAIAGGGFFEHYTDLPISLAWEAFGPKNGAPSLQAVRERIGRLRRETPRPWEDYTIGCILLVEPFFWPKDDWIYDPPAWHPQIVRGRGYDLKQDEDGRKLWEQVLERMEAGSVQSVGEAPPADLPGGYTDPLKPRPRRVGQGTFGSIPFR